MIDEEGEDRSFEALGIGLCVLGVFLATVVISAVTWFFWWEKP